MKKFFTYILLMIVLLPIAFAKDMGSDTLTLNLHTEGYTKFAFTDDDITVSSSYELQRKADKEVISEEELSFYVSVLSTKKDNLNIGLVFPDCMSCNDETITDTIPLTYTKMPGTAVTEGYENQRSLLLNAGDTITRYSGEVNLKVGDATNVAQGEYSATLVIMVTTQN